MLTLKWNNGRVFCLTYNAIVKTLDRVTDRYQYQTASYLAPSHHHHHYAIQLNKPPRNTVGCTISLLYIGYLMSTAMLSMRSSSSSEDFPLRSLFGHLLQYGERPAIAKYITSAKASKPSGLIKEGAGSSLPFTPNDSTLAQSKDPNYIARLGAMSDLLSEGVKSVQDTGITINHVRSFTIVSGGNSIEIEVSMCISGFGVPSVAWITYDVLSAFYDNMRVRNGKQSEYYFPEQDTSDESDPLLVGAHIAMGLYQLQMRDDQLIDPLHKLFKV